MLKLFKKKINNEQLNYINFIENTILPELENGNIQYINFIHGVFATDNNKNFQKKVAIAIKTLTDKLRISQWITLGKRIKSWCYHPDIDRQLISYLYNDIDWKNVSYTRDRFQHLSQEEYVLILKLGTYFFDGY